MRATVDTTKCVGHARCNAIAPDVYELDDDGYVVPPGGDVPAAFENQARAGVDACPERALTVA